MEGPPREVDLEMWYTACSLRLTCSSLANSDFLCELVARRHALLPAYLACPGGSRSVPKNGWRAVLANLAKLSSDLTCPVSLSSFRGPDRPLGDGPMSTVELYQHKSSGCWVALKSYSKASLVKHKKVDEAMMERSCLVELRHPLIVRLMSTFQTPDSLYFVLEYCPHGDLVDVARSYPQCKIPVATCNHLALQLFQIIAYIHSKQIIHRDIKAENILLASDLSIRLIDFATSHRLNTPCNTLFVGSPQYVAPEIISGKFPTPKIDLFGAGCVLYFIWLGKHAFLRDTDFLTWKCILEEDFPPPGEQDKELANSYAECVEKCLIKDPDLRPDAIDALMILTQKKQR